MKISFRFGYDNHTMFRRHRMGFIFDLDMITTRLNTEPQRKGKSRPKHKEKGMTMSSINDQVSEVEDEFEEEYDERFFTEDGELNEHFLDDWEDILEETDEGEVDLDYWKEEIDQEDSDALPILLTRTEPELPLTVIFAKLNEDRVGREALDYARARLLETFEKDEDKAIVRRLFEAADQLPQEGFSFVPLPDRRSDYDALIERVKSGEDAKRVLERFAAAGEEKATTEPTDENTPPEELAELVRDED